MSNTIGRAKILTAPCIFFKKRYAAPVREDFRGGFRGGFSGRISGRIFGEDFRGGFSGRIFGAGRRERRPEQAGRDRTSRRPGQSGTRRTRAGGTERRRGRQKQGERGSGCGNGGERERRKRGRREKTERLEKTGKNWKMLEKTGKSDRGLPGRRSGGTGRERHSAVKPRRYRSLKPSSSTSTGQYSRSSSRRKRTV